MGNFHLVNVITCWKAAKLLLLSLLHLLCEKFQILDFLFFFSPLKFWYFHIIEFVNVSNFFLASIFSAFLQLDSVWMVVLLVGFGAWLFIGSQCCSGTKFWSP